MASPANLKFTPEMAEAFCTRYRQSGHLNASADACGLGERTVHDWLSRGASEESGPYRDFRDEIEKIRGAFRDQRAAFHHRIAMGGLFRRPKCKTIFTEKGVPITTDEVERDENGEIQWVEHWQSPDIKALEWEMQLTDPAFSAQATVNVNNGLALAGGQRHSKLWCAMQRPSRKRSAGCAGRNWTNAPLAVTTETHSDDSSAVSYTPSPQTCHLLRSSRRYGSALSRWRGCPPSTA
jgi:hypothetical protein